MTDPKSQSLPDRVNLGCGSDYLSGWWNVDIDSEYDPDQVLDLEETPWPWEDNQFVDILVDNVLEHIDPRRRVPFLSECRRILKPEGELVVRLPTRTGWDVTHYAVPSYTWPKHPRHRKDWDILEINVERVGPGKIMPKRVALFCTRYDILRCLGQIEVRLH